MKTIRHLSAITTRLTLVLFIQQCLYGLYYTKWIDFTEWSTTTLCFESLFILSVVFSSIRDVSERAIEPMKSGKQRGTTTIVENTYTPTE